MYRESLILHHVLFSILGLASTNACVFMHGFDCLCYQLQVYCNVYLLLVRSAFHPGTRPATDQMLYTSSILQQLLLVSLSKSKSSSRCSSELV